MTAKDLYTFQPSKIVMYSVDWCADCRRAKSFFQLNNIPVLEVNVDKDEQAASFVRKVNSGNRVVPTIIFPDGDILTEPSEAQLAEKLEL
ncbi:Putative glutaredoxin.1 [Anaerolineales bacterium]|nr:Putative glutaredoxin.1 [Anaerolineales bacterium]